MKWSTQITAGALQFVLFIGAVIALLLLSFVTLAHTNNLFGKKTDLLVRTIQKTDVGLSYVLKNDIARNDSVRLNLALDDAIDLTATRSYWGAFEKYSMTAQSKKNTFTKVILAGTSTADQRPALYLQDNQRPMIIVGKAKITGEALLPKQGIRPGNIAGNSFYGTALVQGRQRQSAEQLPKFVAGYRTHIQSIFNRTISGGYESISFSQRMQLNNSFKNPVKVLQGDVIQLSGVSLTGHVIVMATRRIVVDPSANLKDVLLLAPEVRIKDGVVGTFQAIASKHIDLGKRCELQYPSALVVVNQNKVTNVRPTVQKPEIRIGNSSMVQGAVLYMESNADRPAFHPQIKIEENATVYGEVYCERNLEHKGSVFGSIFTYGFIALENGSIYQNHLYNGTVESDGVPDNYAGLPLLGTKHQKNSAKWLY